MQNIYRKNNLARNLNKMRKAMPSMYDFYPMTWTLPLEKKDFYNEFKKRKRHQEMYGGCGRVGREVDRGGRRRGKNSKIFFLIFFLGGKKESNRIFILKPEAGAQGKGITLITSLSDVPKDTRCVIQEYINK